MRKVIFACLATTMLLVGMASAYEEDTETTVTKSNGPLMQCGQVYIEAMPGTSISYSETESRTATLSTTGSFTVSYLAGSIGLELKSEGSVTRSFTVSGTFRDGESGYIRWGSTTRSGKVTKITWRRYYDGIWRAYKIETGSASGTTGKYIKTQKS